MYSILVNDMRKIIIVLIAMICSNLVKATEQAPDYLYYNGKKLTLYTGWGHPSPLQTYFYQNDMEYPFIVLSTGNYRGHVAIWEIIDDKLYLKEITIETFSAEEDEEGFVQFTDETYSFLPKEYHVKSKNEESNKDDAVFADWFSGMITCRDDEILYYFYVRYGEVKNIQTLSEKDYKNIREISEKDTSNNELMDKYSMLVLNNNYISYYFRLYENDEIFLNDKSGHFKNKRGHSPLLEFYSNDHMKFPYNWENSEKNGAPNCKWSIIDNKIYLEEVQLFSGLGFYEIEKDSIDLDILFEDNIVNNKVFANWLNGVYLIEYGIEKEHEFGYKEFTATEYVYLRIKGGVIQELYTVPSDFNFRNIPEETDPKLKRIIDEFK